MRSPWLPVQSHPIHRRYHAEDLIRLRRASERRRYVASQRAGRVDPNPHQIDAVVFALQRIRQGGCILADEVGLGKTIEAGLVMAQMMAEGAERILLITPKPLMGQWRQEMSVLFGIDVREGAHDDGGFSGSGVFVAGREFAGSERGAEQLRASGTFDLCIIDEAHEIFAGLYRRYDRTGRVKARSRYAKTAARVKGLLADTPVLLLTATPIQNTLTELWGLVQYVEPTGTLLGDLPTFRTVFCEGDDRRLRPGQGEELRRRIAQVCQRTLRRQAQAFMERQFTRRTARLFEYTMSSQEQALYDDVTDYLMDPKIAAFRGTHRRLLLIGFHRRMASSIRALGDSLDAVARRLRRTLQGPDPETLRMFRRDLEEDEEEDEGEPRSVDEGPPPTDQALTAEIRRVESLAERARGLGVDAKADKLVDAVRFVLERGRTGQGSGKVVIFTEALSTQDYLREVLLSREVLADEEITLFRGHNRGSRAQQAMERWDAEVGSKLPETARPSRSVALKQALVHEFETRSKVFISTEAGAKGLNLQFCDSIINYDLPWNPQRIEQRIGRCHRYGQTRDVTVINFLARDNEAQRLTFQILSRKLELFGTVLDASDAVLHQASERASGALVGALAGDFEARLAEIYERARSPAEIEAGLGSLETQMDEARTSFEEVHERTAGLIETRLDETVRAAFASIAHDAPDELAAFDRDLEGVVTRWLTAIDVPYERSEEDGGVRLRVEPTEVDPVASGLDVRIGHAGRLEDGEVLHLGHRAIRSALDEARRSTREPFRVRGSAEGGPAAGRLCVLKVSYGGFEPTVELIPVFAAAGVEAPAWGDDAAQVMLGSLHDVTDVRRRVEIDDEELDDAIDEALFRARAEVDAREQARFEETIARIERFIEDKILVLERSRADLAGRLEEARARRDAAVGADARTRAELEGSELTEEMEALEAEIERLRARDDEEYQQWRLQAHERRFARPRVERIIEAELWLE
jgi:hypothetical protein